jgi:tRNA dimethylallyltransferase
VETAALMARYGAALPLLDTIGYAEARAHLAGELELEQAIAAAEQRTRQFAKRQRTWFRRQHRPHWLGGSSTAAQCEQALQVVLAGLG